MIALPSRVRRFCPTLFIVLIASAFASTIDVNAQDSDHPDPIATSNPIHWHKATYPSPAGFIVYGVPELVTTLDDGQDVAYPIKAGLMAYYDAWQLGFEMRREAMYFRFMPRSIGRDGYVSGLIEIGFGSVSAESTERPQQPVFNDTRIGGGLSIQTGNSESFIPRFILDASIGVVTPPGGSADMYFNLETGVLARVPLGSFAICLGPVLQYNYNANVRDASGFVRMGEELFSIGIRSQIALNLNRPSY